MTILLVSKLKSKSYRSSSSSSEEDSCVMSLFTPYLSLLVFIVYDFLYMKLLCFNLCYRL